MIISSKIHEREYLSVVEGDYEKDDRFNTDTLFPDIPNDSAIRALSIISGKSYEKVYRELFEISIKDKYIGTLPNSNEVIHYYLYNNMNMVSIKCATNYFTIVDFLNEKEINKTCILVVDNKYYVPIINRKVIGKSSTKSYINELLAVKNVTGRYYFPSSRCSSLSEYLPKINVNKSILDLYNIDRKENSTPNGFVNNNDCVIRSISYATNKSWKETYQNLFKLSLDTADKTSIADFSKNGFPLYNSSKVYGRYLGELGFANYKFSKRIIPIDFFINNRESLFIVVTRKHMMVYDHNTLVDNFIGISPRIINRSLIDPIKEIYFKEELVNTLYI